MANRPVNTGSGGAAMPPPVHHDAIPPAPSVPPPPPSVPPVPADPSPPAPATASSDPGSAPAGHRATRRRPSRVPADRGSGALAWLPYLVVLAGAAIGMFVVWQGSKYAGLGSALVGCSLLAGALFRLVLPARYAGLLSSRRKASDVLAFAAFGVAVLAVAIALP